MKKLKLAVFLIILTIFTSIFCVFFVSNAAQETEILVKEIQSEILSENYISAAKKIEELEEIWEKKSDMLSTIIHHEELDKVNESIKLMYSFLNGSSPEISDFWAESTRALCQISNIKKTEMPSIANLL